MRLNMVNQAQNILSQYRAFRAQVERFESGMLTDANRAAELTRTAYLGGVVDRASLYQTQQVAAQTNSDYLDALQNVWMNATQLSGMLQQEKFQSATTPIPASPGFPGFPGVSGTPGMCPAPGTPGTPPAPAAPKGPDAPPGNLPPMIPPVPPKQ
jgi:hypothetical protein